MGGLGGRVDQAFSLIHHLFKAGNDPGLLNGEIYLLSEQSVTFVLRKGLNSIYGLLPAGVEDRRFTENVGVVPIRGAAVISTKGLEWDVKDWRTEFGGQVSTSNHVKADVVEVEASEQVLFTIELVDTFCAQ
jgi:thiamine pyrophosphokinase